MLTDDAAATVVSSGRNGAGGRHLDGAVVFDPAALTDESINADGVDTGPPDPHFYARPMASPIEVFWPAKPIWASLNRVLTVCRSKVSGSWI